MQSKTNDFIPARRQRMALLLEARRRWQLSHCAARGKDESSKDYRARQNQLKRLRKLQPHVVWAANVARASADTCRNRRRIRDEQAAARKDRGRAASRLERTIQLLEKHEVIELRRERRGWSATRLGMSRIGVGGPCPVGHGLTRHAAFKHLRELMAEGA